MAVAFGRLTIPERGVARVTWFILEFYTPLNFSGMAEDRMVKFVHGLAREVLVLRLKIITQVGVVKVMWRLNFWQNKCYYLENGARQKYTYNGRLIRNRIWPIKWQQRRWPWMTLKVFQRLQAFSNAIRRTFVQYFTRFQLTVLCSRSPCVSWASCKNRETTDKRIVYAGNMKGG